MPIQVEDFVWSQSATSVQITVPLKGVHASKVDIFSTDEYIKASYAPYIFEVFLNAPVNDSRSKAVIKNGQINFDLEKKDGDYNWPELQNAKHKDKEFMRDKRNEAISFAQQKAKEEAERKAMERDQQQKFTVKQQLRVEQEERKKIEEVKSNVSNEAMRDLESWKTSQRNHEVTKHADANVLTNGEDKTSKDRSEDKSQQNASRQNIRPKDKKIFDVDNMPAPRASSTIQLRFTPRAFVTPSRESKAPEEEAWLEKVAEMKKVKTSAESKENLEDMNPIWLKEKGNDFYKKGNFVAAINAFTAAIVLNGTDPSLYNNRAACHLHMKQLDECIQDTTMAFNLLDPPVPANAKSRCIALVRRGTAHFRKENLVEALSDYEAALKIDPTNQNVKDDAEKIRQIIQGT